jgi:hypothetical protein
MPIVGHLHIWLHKSLQKVFTKVGKLICGLAEFFFT